jgi:hypothetical protein
MGFVAQPVQWPGTISRKVANGRNTTDAVLGTENDRVLRSYPGDRGMGVVAKHR